MIGQPASLKTLLEYLRNPATDEKKAILDQRWEALDPALRLPGQGLGQKATGCGATIGIQPRCDFACTGCYLGVAANHVPALTTAAILRQLDSLRGRVRVGLTLTSHHFMSPAELRTEEGRQRLDAFVFRLPYKGGMVPMCRMNADGVRDQLYADIIDGTPVH
jgi:hypothetical protein